MGIERFFSTLSNIGNLWKENSKSSRKNPKILLIDFNSIVHLTSTRVINNFKNYTSDQIEEKILIYIKHFLEHLLKHIINSNNLEILYIAIDGVPTFGKMREQLKRRYMGEILGTKSIWSKNNITPGTKFMKKLNKYLNETISSFKVFLPNIKSIILSDSNENGEGEIKIIKYLQDLELESNSDIVIFSPDSDMVLLNLLIKPIYNVSLLRYNQQKSDLTSLDNKTDFYEILEMKNFRKYLFDYVKENSLKKDLEENKIIRDIILIFNCFGNDFLPKIVSINLRHDFFLVIDMYIVCLNNSGYIINKGNIDFKIIKSFFELLSKYEFENLELEFNRMKYHNFDRVFVSNLYLNINKINNKEALLQDNIKTPFYKLNYLLLRNINKLQLLNIIKDTTKNKDFIKQYGPLYIYFIPKDKLLDDVNLYYKLKNSYPLYKNSNISRNNLKYLPRIYNSSDVYHQRKINELKVDEIELYKITNYLDEYNKILNPVIFEKISDINNMERYYNERYFKNKVKDCVLNYMEGINWIFNHYLKGKNDGLWYYRFSHAPLLKTILENYEIEKYNSIIIREHKLLPYQQYIMVSPYNKKIINLLDKDQNEIEKIYNDLIKLNLIPKEVKFENIDCSGSIFFSKCHPEIIDEINFMKLYKYFIN